MMRRAMTGTDDWYCRLGIPVLVPGTGSLGGYVVSADGDGTNVVSKILFFGDGLTWFQKLP
jgi:hypothetical protein